MDNGQQLKKIPSKEGFFFAFFYHLLNLDDVAYRQYFTIITKFLS